MSEQQIDQTETSQSPKISFYVFLGFSIAMLALGGALTSIGKGPWYEAMNFPPFQPPAWAFGPAWTTILTLTAIATWQVSNESSPEKANLRRVCLALYALQIPLNVAWSALFFTAHYPPAALLEIVVLDIVLLAMVINFSRIRLSAGLMVLPYFLWLLFATAINYWIVQNNTFVA